MQKSALIIGATGLTGSLVLKQLLKREDYEKVILLSRRSVDIRHEKIEEHLGDILNLENFEKYFDVDEVYVCIGTTKKKTPDSEQYRRIDYGIPVQAAHLAKRNGVSSIAVVSAIGANSSSRFKYNRIKGDMEKDVTAAGVPHTFILRPSFIAGQRSEKRNGERFGLFLFKLIEPLFIGSAKKYKAVEAKDIASKMIALCNSNAESQIVESNEITE